ncbi:MAG: nuclear transport factor 2 family protein [Xanthomonadales bacterium]|nr:nuclear transport factor 2 family protein [Gammaproteobacteria bacterium]MBT8052737.1 nuclear transport factor 2 family protein [Gammaproteobacteria bacterium]NND55907.1 nuclear transport factor 2 family protein [Xanthomonadales bacterium]NNK50605.1 nuclear transport factor 2 family protein [Xanthomonadales bacterium]
MTTAQAIRFVSALVVFTGLIACSQPLTLEQRIISTIREMEAKIENGESRAFMEHIAEDFSGQQEVLTRDQVRAMVILQLHRHKRLQAQLFPIRVAESGEEFATAHFRALVTGGAGWIPESGQVYDFETRWQLVDDEWLLHSARWAPVALEQAL